MEETNKQKINSPEMYVNAQVVREQKRDHGNTKKTDWLVIILH